jgi:hypothetical protein
MSFTSSPATPLRPAFAELSVEVGQMLAYVRLKQQASMTAFATQLTQITDALAPSGEQAPAPPPKPVEPAPGKQMLPRLQTALKVGHIMLRSWWSGACANASAVQSRNPCEIQVPSDARAHPCASLGLSLLLSCRSL